MSAGQAEHVVAELDEYVPAAQAVQDTSAEPPSTLYEPAPHLYAFNGAAHAAADVDPAGETWPLGHDVHAAAPVDENVLAVHAEHVVEPV